MFRKSRRSTGVRQAGCRRHRDLGCP